VGHGGGKNITSNTALEIITTQGNLMTNRFDSCNSIEEVVFQAMGFASTCWENMSGTGVFQSTLAKDAGDEAVAKINEIMGG
jgi:hypothetical protein